MPRFETQEQVDKAIVAVKDYRNAVKNRNRAQETVNEKLTALKNVAQVAHNDALKVEEEVRQMFGDYAIDGLPEAR